MAISDFYHDDKIFNSDSADEILKRGNSYEFIDCTFNSIDMTEMAFNKAKFIDCTFIKCNLSNTELAGAIFRNPVFKECRLMGINWCKCQGLTTPAFHHSQLDYCVFLGLKLSQSGFEHCSLKDVDFSEADLSKAHFSHASLENASFNEADLSAADFRGAKDYMIDPRFASLKKTKFSMPEAMTLLRSLDIIIE